MWSVGRDFKLITFNRANGLILEFYRDTVDPMWGKVYRHTLKLNDDGTVSPPDVPGIGADPNYETLAQYRVA